MKRCAACGAPWALVLATWAECAWWGCRLFAQRRLDELDGYERLVLGRWAQRREAEG